MPTTKVLMPQEPHKLRTTTKNKQTMKNITVTKANKESSVIPDATYWDTLRAAYFKAKQQQELEQEKEAEQKDEHDEWLEKCLKASYTGALIEYEVRWSDYGRGLFAAQPVQAGAPVWRCEHSGLFQTGQQWRYFLALLPPHMQRDCVDWFYVEDGLVYMPLDPAAMINHGGPVLLQEEGFEAHLTRMDNVECIKIAPNAEDDEHARDEKKKVEDVEEEWKFFAKCDILPGDELLCDYSSINDYNAPPIPWLVESRAQILEKEVYY
jgi:hypothetical protein